MTLVKFDLILGLLMEEPKHPYAIQSDIKSREMDKYIPFAKESLYYAIKKLTEDGLVKPAGTEESAAGPERTVYAIKPSGAKALAQMIHEDLKAGPPHDRTWVAVIPFMRHLEAKDRQVLFAALIQAKQKQVKEIRKALREREGSVPPIALMIGNDSLKRMELDIEFLAEIGALDLEDRLWPEADGSKRRK